MDDFFRESLKEIKVEPSPPAKARFIKGASAQGGWSSLLHWQNILLISGLLMTVAVLIYFSTSFRPGKPAVSTPSATVRANHNLPHQEPVSNHAEQNKIVSAATPRPSQDSNLPRTSLPQTAVRQEKNVISANHSQTDLFPSSTKQAFVKEAGMQNVTDNPAGSMETASLSGIPSSSKEEDKANVESGTASKAKTEPLSNPVHNEEVSSESPDNIDNSPKNLQTPRWNWERYLRYDLDVKIAENPVRINHSLSFETRFSKDRFFIIAGAGMVLSNGRQLYRVDYNEYLGTYKKLDSITFEWDRDHYHLLPAFHSSPTQVYDTTLKIDTYSVKKQYRKIRIPVTIGYRVLESGKFSLDIGAGAEYVLFSSSKESAATYFAGTNRVIAITAEQDAWSRNYFYLLAEAAAMYRLNERFSFQLSPTLKYLLNPLKTADIKQVEPIIRGSFLMHF